LKLATRPRALRRNAIKTNMHILTRNPRAHLTALLLAAALAGCTHAPPPGAASPATPASDAAPAGWRLVWADEFNGTTVDTTRWTFETGGHGWGNNELEHYTPGDNATVQGGLLVIEARQEAKEGRQYTSTRMITKGKAAWTYGRVAARIKMPQGKGIWPAFWMLGENIGTVGWPRSGEIDIVEMVGGPSRDGTADNDGVSNSALHRPSVGTATGEPHKSQGGKTTLPGGAKLSQDFHVYAVEWDAVAIRFLLDEKLVLTTDIAAKGDGYEAFHRPLLWLGNLAVGGNWPGPPDATTTWPQRMSVDWVRVYQR
jgi:beta-glucanase (GH16 family)